MNHKNLSLLESKKLTMDRNSGILAADVAMGQVLEDMITSIVREEAED